MKWLKALTVEEKDALLCAAVRERRPTLGSELLRRYHDANPPGSKKAAFTKPRTAGEIRSAAKLRSEERERELAARKRAEKRRREAQQAAARAAYLDRLAARKRRLGTRSET